MGNDFQSFKVSSVMIRSTGYERITLKTLLDSTRLYFHQNTKCKLQWNLLCETQAMEIPILQHCSLYPSVNNRADSLIYTIGGWYFHIPYVSRFFPTNWVEFAYKVIIGFCFRIFCGFFWLCIWINSELLFIFSYSKQFWINACHTTKGTKNMKKFNAKIILFFKIETTNPLKSFIRRLSATKIRLHS